MIIAGPNLTLDRIVRIDELRPGEVLRFSEATIAPGGKGVNVARVARDMGFPAILVSLAPGHTGRAVVDLLHEEGLHVETVPTGGEARAATIVLEAGGRITVLNEPGPAIGGEDWAAYERAVDERLPGHGFLICVGSTPPGSPPDAYGRLVHVARARGIRTLVDAAGDSLAAALIARPDLVTPSLAEAEGVLRGGAPQSAAERSPGMKDRAVKAATAMVERGARTAVVTVGSGVAVDQGSERWWVDAPGVLERNPIGAGDSLVGGLVGSLEGGQDLAASIRAGVAAAAASVEMDLPGLVDPERVRSLIAEVELPNPGLS